MKILSLVFTFLFIVTPVFATEPQETSSAFRSFLDVTSTDIKVPTVIEVPFEHEMLSRKEFLVIENQTGTSLPWHFHTEREHQATPMTATSSMSLQTETALLDNNFSTYAEYLVSENTPDTVHITLKADEPVTSSRLHIHLDEYVALPQTIEIRARTETNEKIVLAETRMTNTAVNFPEMHAEEWMIKLTYAQPLRITEINLHQKNEVIDMTSGLRFLAQPEHTYRVYFNPDRSVPAPVGESPNLRDDTDVVRLKETTAPQENPTYTLSDIDNDSIPDIHDNCVRIPNTNQADIDGNERGDACDDFDRDGMMNIYDNCVNVPNRSQKDTDEDRIGDACDSEESRLTERLSWLPWVFMGGVALIILTLFISTTRRNKRNADSEHTDDHSTS